MYLQIPWCTLSMENPEMLHFSKETGLKWFSSYKWEKLYFYVKNCKSTIMQTMSRIWVKFTVIATEISLSIILPPIF